MKKDKNDIIKFIDKALQNLKNLRESNLIESNQKEKDRLEARIEAFEEIRSSFDLEVYLPKNKQLKRILRLAKSREQDWDTKDQLNEINLYSKIKEVIPYIMAVSYRINMEEKHLTEDLLSFCENQLEIIDSSTYKRKITFPTKEEIETAFKCYTERIKPNKIPALKVYKQPEVNQKIEDLYQMFLKLDNSGSIE